jgi:hypothetical protein
MHEAILFQSLIALPSVGENVAAGPHLGLEKPLQFMPAFAGRTVFEDLSIYIFRIPAALAESGAPPSDLQNISIASDHLVEDRVYEEAEKEP